MNSFTIAGKIGRDAEVRYTDGGRSVTNFSVAVNRYKKEVMWVRVAVWGEYGESISQYLTKGTSVAVQGELDVRTYESDGGTKVSIDLNGRQVTLLGGNQDGGGRRGKPAPKKAKREEEAEEISDSFEPDGEEALGF